MPTFRPNAVVQLDRPGWADQIALLAKAADTDTGDYPGYLEALRRRRAAFAAAGALATDHGHRSASMAPLPDAGAAAIYRRALAGVTGAAAAGAFAGHMLHVLAGMACDDGLVMQLHPGSSGTITTGCSVPPGRTGGSTSRWPPSSPARCVPC